MSNELVSVVMAVHNVEKWIQHTLESLQNQTYDNFECVIVDDHSTDSTVNIILNCFCKKDNRFKLFVNCTDLDKPYTDAHNLSYSLGKGKYLIRFDGDDIMLPDHIETIVSEMDEHPEYDAVCTNIDRVELDDNDVLRPAKLGDREMDSISENNIEMFNRYPSWTYKENMLSWNNQASAIRKSFYDLHHPMFEILKNGDYVFWLSMLSIGAKLHKINKVTLKYLLHSDSICHSDLFKTYDNIDNCNFQLMCAVYKANAFSKYPKDTIFPDGTSAYDCMMTFQKTADYFKKYKAERFGSDKVS